MGVVTLWPDNPFRKQGLVVAPLQPVERREFWAVGSRSNPDSELAERFAEFLVRKAPRGAVRLRELAASSR